MTDPADRPAPGHPSRRRRRRGRLGRRPRARRRRRRRRPGQSQRPRARRPADLASARGCVERRRAARRRAERGGHLQLRQPRVHALGRPTGRRWPQAFLEYAERTGAVLATVSNLYGYGPVDVPMTEDLPLAATGTKARVRVRMWQDAKAANDAGRIRATEVRGSDYICPGAQSMLGDRVMPRDPRGQERPAARRPRPAAHVDRTHRRRAHRS